MYHGIPPFAEFFDGMGSARTGGEVLDVSDAIVFKRCRCSTRSDERKGQVMGGVTVGEILELEEEVFVSIYGGGSHGGLLLFCTSYISHHHIIRYYSRNCK
jgi:hypothetical protein